MRNADCGLEGTGHSRQTSNSPLPPQPLCPSFQSAIRNPQSAIAMVPGEIIPADAPAIAANVDLEIVTLDVANTGDRPVQVGSHFHFFEVNSALRFDRATARGFRLNIPAGTAVRFEAG